MAVLSSIRSLFKGGTIGNMLSCAIFGGAFIVSLFTMNRAQKETFDDSKINLRIAHWQLELGYRDALDRIIREYEAIHPNVRIHQIPVSVNFYSQVINTHLVGGTAPDLIEIGMASMSDNDQYLVRYFEPMSRHILKPNPYNKGTDLENTPWRDTFFDALNSFYKPVLQDYYGVGTSMFTVRFFYNKDLFRKAAGSEKSPRSYEEMMEVCGKLRAYGETNNLDLVPIAGSGYNSHWLFEHYRQAFFATYNEQLDTDMDGNVTGLEFYLGVKNNTIGWDDPTNKACYTLLRELSGNLQNGFMAVGREQASFLFIQGNAAMIASGSWDAGSLFGQARFPVGIFDIPLPCQPVPYGEHIRGRISEAAEGTGSGFGVCRYSQHKDVAIDFLRFLTSRRNNQQFNRDIDWVPAVIGAQASPQMAAFAPNPEGFTSFTAWEWGTRSTTIYWGTLARYVQNEISFEEFGKKVIDGLDDPNYGWKHAATREYETNRNSLRIQEQLLGVLTSDDLFFRSYPDYKRRYQEALIRQLQMAYTMEECRDRLQKGLKVKLEVK